MSGIGSALLSSLLPWRNTYLIDFAVFMPPEELRVDLADVEKAWLASHAGSRVFQGGGAAQDEEEALQLIEFQAKVFTKAGLGADATFLPKSIHPKFCGAEPKTDLNSAYDECRMAICGAVQALLDKTGMSPKEVDILITTCSIYCPTPSIASMVANAFGMRSDCLTYHLGGMGCSNGVVAINLVSDMLKAHPGKRALFVTNETTTPAFYRGIDRHRLVTNVLFRMGAAAMLLSNRRSDAARAKYKCYVRTRVCLAARNDSYKCIWYGPDELGNNGVYLGMNVVTEASRGLTQAMTKVSPYIMTWSEIGRYLTWAVKTTLIKGKAKSKAKEEACPTGATAGTSGSATASADSASSPADKDKSAAAPAGPAETHGSGQASASTGHEPDTAASSTSATAAAGREGGATASEPAGPDATAAAAAAAGSSKPATDSIMVGRKHTARERIHKIADYIRDAHYGPQPSRRSLVPLPDSTTFTPRFSDCCQHFLIHAGGAKVLDGIGAALRLDEYHLAPSRAVLHDYGNVSSSTTWYTLAYIEATRGVLAGDRVLQVGVGSGIKCGVNVWQALRDVHDVHPAWRHRYLSGEAPPPAFPKQALMRLEDGATPPAEPTTPVGKDARIAGLSRTRRSALSGPDFEVGWMLLLAMLVLLIAMLWSRV